MKPSEALIKILSKGGFIEGVHYAKTSQGLKLTLPAECYLQSVLPPDLCQTFKSSLSSLPL